MTLTEHPGWERYTIESGSLDGDTKPIRYFHYILLVGRWQANVTRYTDPRDRKRRWTVKFRGQHVAGGIADSAKQARILSQTFLDDARALTGKI